MQSQAKRRIAFGITTGGLLAGGGLGFAHADAGTTGGTSNSPGILSGNLIQVPVDIPINVCGVTADVIGLLNPAAGNECSNSGGASASGDASGAAASGGASANGSASDSPGILSGNSIQAPVHIPVNVCGDTVNVVGALNPAVHNHCANHGGSTSGSGGGASASGSASGSPGIGSGNNVQIPIDVPVNACGDTVNVIGALNPAKHNHCDNHGGSGSGGGSSANGSATGSPGILSGNNVQVPIDVPVNVCGDTVNVIGLKNVAKDNSCSNGGPLTPPSSTPPTSPPTTTPSTPSGPPTSVTSTPGGPGVSSSTPGTSHFSSTPPEGETQPGGGSLAHTGSNALMLAPVGAGLAAGGLVLYRKFKPSGSHTE